MTQTFQTFRVVPKTFPELVVPDVPHPFRWELERLGDVGNGPIQTGTSGGSLMAASVQRGAS